MPLPGTDIRTRLKNATAELHRSLDGHRAMAGITEAGFPLDRYHAVLQANHAFYATLEPQLDAAFARLSIPFDYVARRKLPLLDRDLQWFGLPRGTSKPDALPWDISDVASLAGILYVVEGSTLGGQVIARALEKHLGLTSSRGSAFFTGHGEQTRSRWVELLAFLETAAPDEASAEKAEMYACRTFTRFGEAMDDFG